MNERHHHVIDYNERDRREGRWYKARFDWFEDGTETMISPLLWHRHNGHGIGVRVKRSGSGRKLSVSLYAGKLGSLWLKVRSPRLPAWVETDDYEGRIYGAKIRPWGDCYFEWDWHAKDGHWSRSDPWWMNVTITKTTIWGRTDCTTEIVEEGMTSVPMPEGSYPAGWKRERRTWRHRRWPGTWRDRVTGIRTNVSVSLDIPGGIPVEGKGENSWDCGMDGLFGCGGDTVPSAVGNAVRNVLRDRDRYGGPHDLTRPMSVSEVEAVDTDE